MKLKRIYLVALILLVLLSVSAVSAADDSANNIISEDNDVIALDEAIDDDESNMDVLGENENAALNAGEPGTFTDLNKLINEDYASNATISLGSDYTYTSSDSEFIHGIPIGRAVTIDGNGHTIDGNHAARIFNVDVNDNVKFMNINFINGNATGGINENKGGAIYSVYFESIAENCNFTDNSAQDLGGALFKVNASNCNFTGNSATDGGAMFVGSSVGCTFSGNSATGDGGAMYLGSSVGCTFIGNSASYGGAMEGGAADGCTFIGNSATDGGAMDGGSAVGCTFSGNSATDGGAMYFGSAVGCTFIGNSATGYGGAMDGGSAVGCTFILILQSIDDTVLETSCDCDGDCIYVVAKLSASDFTSFAHSGEIMPFKLSATVDDKEIVINGTEINITVSQEGQTVGNYSAKSGEGWAVDLDAGKYNATFSIEGSLVQDVTVELNIQKIVSEITPSEDNINLFVGDSSKVDYSLSPSGATGDIKFVSSDPNVVTVDSSGAIRAVGVGTATITISLISDNYYAPDATVTVVVSKKDTQLSANAKSFKFEDKVKSYSVTLKDKNGNVLKNKKVSLKVNGATYTATTNSKGVATFKLTKLSKKGTYNAVISFAGDKDYNKISKSAKLTVKAPAWKTIAKGSKDKAMVKKIQMALKKNGFYLSYKGRYLKVDGLFHKYTQMAVKQFQKAKKLKVTGKVDYATAKKLKLI